jgi:hypothetical protein
MATGSFACFYNTRSLVSFCLHKRPRDPKFRHFRAFNNIKLLFQVTAVRIFRGLNRKVHKGTQRPDE